MSSQARRDPEKVQQIILNLLTNAIKFTPSSGRIDIDTMHSEAKDRATIIVRDNGVGLPPDKLDAIVQPFIQLVHDGGPREGVGLGLAISRDLARGMGGDLVATTNPDQGSTFTLSLPLTVADATLVNRP